MSTVQTDCDSCKVLAVLSQFHLGHNATEIQTSDLLQKICHLHPNAIPQVMISTIHHNNPLKENLCTRVKIPFKHVKYTHYLTQSSAVMYSDNTHYRKSNRLTLWIVSPFFSVKGL